MSRTPVLFENDITFYPLVFQQQSGLQIQGERTIRCRFFTFTAIWQSVLTLTCHATQLSKQVINLNSSQYFNIILPFSLTTDNLFRQNLTHDAAESRRQWRQQGRKDLQR